MEMRRRVFLKMAGWAAVGAALLRPGNDAMAAAPASTPPDGGGTVSGPEFALPAFEKRGGIPLEQALEKRRTTRGYAAGSPLTAMELSRLLWAAGGVNRPDGKRTAPSAMAKYPVELYAALPAGAYRYDPAGHRLVRVLDRDLRPEIPAQEGFARAGVILLFVVRKELVPQGRMEWADVEIGAMGQNAFLQAASLGLASVMFAYVNVEPVSAALGFGADRVLRLGQAVGRGA